MLHGEYGVFDDTMRFGNEVAVSSMASGRAWRGGYEWSFDGETLSMTLIEDACAPDINRQAEWQSGGLGGTEPPSAGAGSGYHAAGAPDSGAYRHPAQTIRVRAGVWLVYGGERLDVEKAKRGDRDAFGRIAERHLADSTAWLPRWLAKTTRAM